MSTRFLRRVLPDLWAVLIDGRAVAYLSYTHHFSFDILVPGSDTLRVLARDIEGKLTDIARRLAEGEFDDANWQAPRLCDWLIQVANNNPEPDSPEDCYDIVECGAPLDINEHGSWRCEAGHEHVSYDDPSRGAYEAEMAFMERQEDERGRWTSAALR